MKILLASKSPRRKQLLKQANIKFTIKTSGIEEVFPQNISLYKIPVFLAQKKAKAVLHNIKDNQVILSADTLVFISKKIIGKPENYSDAVNILSTLSGKKHTVITGVCLLSKEKIKTFSVSTHVYFRKLSVEQIHFYLQKHKPYDKAGSYAIQEWIGLIAVKKIEGDYFNIVGLPIGKVIEELKKF